MFNIAVHVVVSILNLGRRIPEEVLLPVIFAPSGQTLLALPISNEETLAVEAHAPANRCLARRSKRSGLLGSLRRPTNEEAPTAG
jgi:hypothetical protein